MIDVDDPLDLADEVVSEILFQLLHGAVLSREGQLALWKHVALVVRVLAVAHDISPREVAERLFVGSEADDEWRAVRLPRFRAAARAA